MIIYKDKNYVICSKLPGVSSQISDKGPDMPELLSHEMGIPQNKIHPIHRLDVAVGGTMIYALGEASAARLCTLVSDRTMEKRYLAVIHGEPSEENAVMKDYLFKDSSKNKSFVVKRLRKGVKVASLEYEVLAVANTDTGKASLVRILLHTGRTHQIRVQFSHRKTPLYGDRRYGSGNDGCAVALWSNSIDFNSPFDGEGKHYSSLPDTDSFPWNLFDKKHYT